MIYIYMNKWQSIGLLLSLCMFLFLNNCQETSGPGLSNKGDSVPEKTDNVKVENIPGGAHITYDLPESEDMLYIQAVYSTKGLGQQETKSTYYQDSLTIKGFADTTSK